MLIWALGALTFFHVAAAIAWWGASATLQGIVIPAARRLPPDQQAAWWRALAGQVKIFFPVAGGLTILLGIARGIAGGVFSYLATPYGYTWIAALVLGIALAAWGARVTAPHSERLSESSSENVGENTTALQRVGRIEQAGFAVMLVLMVAMRLGY